MWIKDYNFHRFFHLQSFLLFSEIEDASAGSQVFVLVYVMTRREQMLVFSPFLHDDVKMKKVMIIIHDLFFSIHILFLASFKSAKVSLEDFIQFNDEWCKRNFCHLLGCKIFLARNFSLKNSNMIASSKKF